LATPSLIGGGSGGDMFNRRILIATDGSELSMKAASVAVELARAVGAEVVAFTALSTFPYAGIGESSGVAAADHESQAGALASERLAHVQQLAQQAGVACHTSMVEDDEPYRAIVATADKHDCGLIVLASHGRRGVGALLLGSETQRVLTHTDRPVLVVR
jgi:nucleotide-binding universal stress UspA family protein